MLDKAIARSVRILPRPLVARVARRYIAGEDLGSAVAAIQELAGEGCAATMDVVGEHITSVEAAAQMREAYKDALRAIAGNSLPSGVSVKLTSLGLRTDYDLCRRNLHEVLATGSQVGRFVRVDMEESVYTDATLDLVVEAHRQGRRVGAVIQARLRRSPEDVARLAAEGVPIRLVKGIYLEPPDMAITGFEQIRGAFLRLLEQLLEARVDLAIATHDDMLVARSLDLLGASTHQSYEFQMLLGVRPELRRRLVAAGHRVRVYVPFGKDWFAYSVRRLRENPRMAMLIARALVWP